MKADNPEECEKIERALSKRLEAHDKSRRDAQDKLEETCKGLEASIVKFEERVSSELEEKSAAENNRLQSALDALQTEGDCSPKAVQRAKEALLVVQSYDVVKSNVSDGNTNGGSTINIDVWALYKLKTEKKNCSEKLCEKEREEIERILNERIESHDNSRRATQDKLHELCEGLRKQVDDLKGRVNKELEEKFTAEDRRLQALLNELRTANGSDVPEVLQRAKAGLLVVQSYEIVKGKKGSYGTFVISSLCELRVERIVASLELIDFEGRKAAVIVPLFTERGDLSLYFTFFNEDEVEVLKSADSSPFEVEVVIWRRAVKKKAHQKHSQRSTSPEVMKAFASGPYSQQAQRTS